MKEVATKLDVSVSTVSWWMNKHKISRRDRSSANYLKYNKEGDPFKIKTIKSNDDAVLYGIGIGLFWGEGNKVSNTSLRLGNTDSDLIKTYVRFLRDFCCVKENKIRFGIQIFNDSNKEDSLHHWMKELGIRRNQILKTVSVVPPQGKGTYRKINKYGVVTVYVNNIKLVDWMHQQLDVFRK